MWSPSFVVRRPGRADAGSLRPWRGSQPSPPGRGRHRTPGSHCWPAGNYRHRRPRATITGSAGSGRTGQDRGRPGFATGVVHVVGTIVTVIVLVLVVAGAVWLIRQRSATRARELDDARAEARRWVERLGGQVLNLTGSDEASKQALADASERFTAAGSQLDQARSTAQARQVTETAYEGLYYVRAARSAMGIDPGPELPPLPGQQRAGA